VALTNDEILLKAYAAYNHQDSEALLALVNENVDCHNGSARLAEKTYFDHTGPISGQRSARMMHLSRVPSLRRIKVSYHSTSRACA